MHKECVEGYRMVAMYAEGDMAWLLAVADPGFSRGGGVNPPGGA